MQRGDFQPATRVKNLITRLDKSHWTRLNSPMGLKFYCWARLSFLSLLSLQWAEIGFRIIRRDKNHSVCTSLSWDSSNKSTNIKSQALWAGWNLKHRDFFLCLVLLLLPTTQPLHIEGDGNWKRPRNFSNLISAFTLNTLICNTPTFLSPAHFHLIEPYLNEKIPNDKATYVCKLMPCVVRLTHCLHKMIR